MLPRMIDIARAMLPGGHVGDYEIGRDKTLSAIVLVCIRHFRAAVHSSLCATPEQMTTSPSVFGPLRRCHRTPLVRGFAELLFRMSQLSYAPSFSDTTAQSIPEID